MKKTQFLILIPIALFFVVMGMMFVQAATYGIGLTSTTTSPGIAIPNYGGKYFPIQVPYITATSTTATSTFAGSVTVQSINQPTSQIKNNKLNYLYLNPDNNAPFNFGNNNTGVLQVGIWGGGAINTDVNINSTSNGEIPLFVTGDFLTPSTDIIKLIDGFLSPIFEVNSNGAIGINGSLGTNGYVLKSGGAGAAAWVATSSLGITGGASLSGGSTNTMTYWTSPTTVGATSSPTVGYITATSTATSTFAGDIKLSTANSTIKGTGNYLTLQNTTGSGVRISQAGGNNGATFFNTDYDLVDFAFNPSSGVQQNIRYEHRATGSGGLGYGNTGGEFQIGPSGSPNFIIGATSTVIASGNLGVGGTFSGLYQPQSSLDILDTSRDLSGTVTLDTNTQGIVIRDNYSGSGSGAGLWFQNGGLPAGIGSTRVSGGDWATDLRFYTHPAAASNQLLLSERMRINSEGNVGIGTTTPTNKLEVNGNTFLGGNLMTRGNATVIGSLNTGYITSPSGMSTDYISGYSDGSNYLRNSSGEIQLGDPDGNYTGDYLDYNVNTGVFADYPGGTLGNTYNDGSNNMLIKGKIGIGTTTPTTQLQVTTSASNATTTLTIGKLGQNKGSCLEMYDVTGAVQYVRIIASAFVISSTSCK